MRYALKRVCAQDVRAHDILTQLFAQGQDFTDVRTVTVGGSATALTFLYEAHILDNDHTVWVLRPDCPDGAQYLCFEQQPANLLVPGDIVASQTGGFAFAKVATIIPQRDRLTYTEVTLGDEQRQRERTVGNAQKLTFFREVAA
jgi:hypothetical protein